MKFFVTSDIHSFYEPFIKALNEVGFDPNNEEHWLIVCGDCFDRGPDSEQVLKFLMSLERKILIKGNHDILLDSCCKREFPLMADVENGTKQTIDDLGKTSNNRLFDDYCKHTWNRLAAYRDSLVNYFETENYIFVHSWIPTAIINDGFGRQPWHLAGKIYSYNEDWRKATDSEWEEAMWGNPFYLESLGLNKTGKTIVFGHWHCSAGWARDEERSEFGPDAEWNPYYGKNVISIDRCTAYTGECNVLVLEDNFLENT